MKAKCIIQVDGIYKANHRIDFVGTSRDKGVSCRILLSELEVVRSRVLKQIEDINKKYGEQARFKIPR